MVVQAKNVEIGLVDFSLKGVHFKHSSIQYSYNYYPLLLYFLDGTMQDLQHSGDFDPVSEVHW